jgi:hypothetical protein
MAILLAKPDMAGKRSLPNVSLRLVNSLTIFVQWSCRRDHVIVGEHDSLVLATCAVRAYA